jgi:membrane protease YdiL (CAAX protease family)
MHPWQDEPLTLSIYYFVRDGVSGLILLLGLRLLKASLAQLGLSSFRWTDVGIGLLAAILVHFAFREAAHLLHLHATEVSKWNDRLQGHAHGLAAVLFVAMIGIISPIIQELYFRGALMKALGGFMPTIATVAVSSLIFASWHYVGGLEQTSFAFFTGMTAAILYVRTRNLTAACTMHIALNCYAVISLIQTNY